MQKPNLLQIKDLTIEFDGLLGNVTAVDGISFELKKGETLGIVGESGSGKSITSLSIMGLLPKAARLTSGEIIFHKNDHESIDLTKCSNKTLQRYRGEELAMVFQEPMTSLNPVFKCGDQVVEAISVHQKINKQAAKQKAIAWFDRVKLNDPIRIFDSYPHQLSGGQRQRVMIAMAMVLNPSVLIADEPTSALDVTVQSSILNLIKELKEKWDGSIIFISHDLSVIADVSDRVLVMQQGKIVESGPIDQVFRNPEHEYTKELLKDFKDRTHTNSKVIEKNAPILSVQHLKTWFPGSKSFLGKEKAFVKAVNDVSLDIYEGETLGLVGESGSGKTTLGRSILRLEKPRGGEVIYDGNALHQLPDDGWKSMRRELQIIFQDPYSSLNPRQMIGSAIMEPMKVHGIGKNEQERRTKTMELLMQVGLQEEHFWRFPKEFSGGQRQRICIARALSVEPKFLICDECVSALDVTVQSKILRLLQKLQQEKNLTYLFISHDLSVVRQICDRIAVMKNGKIVEIGTTESIYLQPENDYTRHLIEAIPKWI
ncbi:MAG: ABC transporter ATP-binding protein [Bacteroidota bacterium]